MTSRKLIGYRAIEIIQILTIVASPLPYLLCQRYLDSSAVKWYDNDLGPIILTCMANYIIAMIAVSSTFLIRRIKNGPSEHEGLLHFLIVVVAGLASFLLFCVAYALYPIAVVGIGIYNLVIVEKEIRKAQGISQERFGKPIIE